MQDELHMWAVFDHPPDYPGHYVARLSVMGATRAGVTDVALFSTTLDGLRAKLPPGLERWPRQPGDPDYLIETWL